MSETDKTLGVEPHIIINPDRTITVPEELKKIAIQYDHNIETVTFDCCRYWDEHDLSKMQVFVNYLRSDGAIKTAPCEIIPESITEDSMSFTWTISNNVTITNGQLVFLVCFKDTDPSGNELHHWNSERNSDLYVGEGLEAGEAEEGVPDLVVDLRSRMAELELIGLSHAVSVEEVEGGHKVVISDVTGNKSYTVKDGATFTPSVSEEGDLSWSNDQELPNPPTVNITGPRGLKGDRGDMGGMFEELELLNGSTNIVNLLHKYRFEIGWHDDPKQDITTIPSTEEHTLHPSSSMMVRVGSKIYLPPTNELMTNPDIKCFDINTKTVETITSSLSEGITVNYKFTGYGGIGVVKDSKIYWFACYYPSNTILEYDYELNTHRYIHYTADDLPFANFEHNLINSSVLVGTKRYTFADNESSAFADRITIIDIYDGGYEEISQAFHKSIGEVTVESVGSKIYIFGGKEYGGDRIPDIYEFDTETKTMSLIGTLPKAMVFIGARAIGSKIYLFGEDSVIYQYDTDAKNTLLTGLSLPTKSYDNANIYYGISPEIDSKIYIFETVYTPNEVPKYTYSVYEFAETSISKMNDCSLHLQCHDKTHSFDLAEFVNENFDRFDFEILSIKQNKETNDCVIAYEINGHRKTDTVSQTTFDLESSTLLITGVERALLYNDEIGYDVPVVLIDKTLTEEGKAADAAAVGDALHVLDAKFSNVISTPKLYKHTAAIYDADFTHQFQLTGYSTSDVPIRYSQFQLMESVFKNIICYDAMTNKCGWFIGFMVTPTGINAMAWMDGEFVEFSIADLASNQTTVYNI